MSGAKEFTMYTVYLQRSLDLGKDIPKIKEFLDSNGLQIARFVPASGGEAKLGVYNVTL